MIEVGEGRRPRRPHHHVEGGADGKRFGNGDEQVVQHGGGLVEGLGLVAECLQQRHAVGVHDLVVGVGGHQAPVAGEVGNQFEFVAACLEMLVILTGGIETRRKDRGELVLDVLRGRGRARLGCARRAAAPPRRPRRRASSSLGTRAHRERDAGRPLSARRRGARAAAHAAGAYALPRGHGTELRGLHRRQDGRGLRGRDRDERDLRLLRHVRDDDREDRERLELAAEVCRRTLLDRRSDLLHTVSAFAIR